MILLKGSARVAVPEDLRNAVLGLYVHYNRDGDYIRNYKYADGYAYLPPNMAKLQQVSEILSVTIDDQRSAGDPLQAPFVLADNFTFRPHQSVPANQLLQHCREKNYGLLSAPCGNGKTVVMSWIAGNLGCKTLILVDMTSLVSQWDKEYRMVWGREIQLIDKDTTTFGDVCVATFQLLNNNPALVSTLREKFGTLLLDEFHTTCSDTRREILFRMNNKYRIGCTATLLKKGYDSAVLTDYVSAEAVAMKDLNALKPEVHFVETGRPWYSSNPDDWGKIISHMSKDEARNRQMATLALAMATAGRRVLVIGNTVESLKFICGILAKDPFCRPIVYVGSTTLKQDLALKEDIESGAVNIVCSSRKFDKGIDCPALDCLILGKPMNNESGVTQISGRIVRSLEGKPTPTIYDLVDKCDLAETFAKNRKRWYRKLGYTIKELDNL